MYTWIVAASLIVGAPALKDKSAVIELAGEWEVAAYVLNGMEAKPGVHIRFDGMMAVFSGGPFGTTHNGTYTSNLNQTPAELDIRFPDGNGAAMIGIIKRNGDDLILCFGAETRPTTFESPVGSGIGLLTLKRVKK